VTWQEKAQEGDLQGAVLEYVRRFDFVTFAELQQRLEPFAAVRGQISISMSNLGLVLWAGLSGPLADAILALVKAGMLCYEATDQFAYWLDGMVLDLPLPQRIPKGGYKQPRWLPVCLRPGDGQFSPTGGDRISKEVSNAVICG